MSVGSGTGRSREGVALLVSERVKKSVVEWKEVSLRLMWIKMRVGKSGYVVVLGDWNAQVGNEEVENVVGKYGVRGRNQSGRRLLEMCMEQDLFKKSGKRISSRGLNSNGEGTVIDRALRNYILIDKRVVGRLVDVHILRGEGGGMSDHF
uniref:Endonuclease/exonuclease/phosphatase domain-containing protein n=1 Tax=Octopus bimaculoides TaxID=37653 RepID=A0A0L8GKW8_OCTBM